MSDSDNTYVLCDEELYISNESKDGTQTVNMRDSGDTKQSDRNGFSNTCISKDSVDDTGG